MEPIFFQAVSDALESQYLVVGDPSRYSQTLHVDEMLY